MTSKATFHVILWLLVATAVGIHGMPDYDESEASHAHHEEDWADDGGGHPVSAKSSGHRYESRHVGENFNKRISSGPGVRFGQDFNSLMKKDYIEVGDMTYNPSSKVEAVKPKKETTVVSSKEKVTASKGHTGGGSSPSRSPTIVKILRGGPKGEPEHKKPPSNRGKPSGVKIIKLLGGGGGRGDGPGPRMKDQGPRGRGGGGGGGRGGGRPKFEGRSGGSKIIIHK